MGATILQRAWKAIGATAGFEEGASIFSSDDADRAYFLNGQGRQRPPVTAEANRPPPGTPPKPPPSGPELERRRKFH